MAQKTAAPSEVLFELAMKGQWHKVVTEYKNGLGDAQYAKITSAEDTILHIAVTEDETYIVMALVEAVVKEDVLEIGNDMGNTPLHLAAAAGKVAMCKCMVEKHEHLLAIPNNRRETPVKDLLAIRNNCGETPLFVAALHGKKKAFLYLHSKCPPQHGSDYWRRKDGNNVLHAAISGEYFGKLFA